MITQVTYLSPLITTIVQTARDSMKRPLTTFYLTFINTYHALEEKIDKNSQSRGLKWPKVSKKRREELT